MTQIGTCTGKAVAGGAAALLKRSRIQWLKMSAKR